MAMYVLLNLMTDGIDVYRVASVLGCPYPLPARDPLLSDPLLSLLVIVYS